MPDNGATEALLARLSYHASLRASEAARRAANRLPTQRIAKIALLFCLLVSFDTILKHIYISNTFY